MWTAFDIFGTDVTDNESNQKTLYYATSSKLCLCTTWKTGKHGNFIFHSNAVLLHYLNLTSSLLSSDIFLTRDSFHAAVWLTKSCNQCVQLGAVGGIVQGKRSRERCRSWTVLHAQCTSALSSGFPISQRNAEALDRQGGKTNHRLISNFLSYTSAKNYRNRMVYVKIITSQRLDIHFLRQFIVYQSRRRPSIVQSFVDLRWATSVQ